MNRRLLALIPLLLVFIGCQRPPEILRLNGETMGTTWSVSVVTDRSGPDGSELQGLLEDRLARINQLMSTFDPNSEISRFNRLADTSWFPISVETYLVIRLALQISELTAGSFDVSVGPLVNLWGFGTTGRPQHRPTPEQLATALGSVGYRLIDLMAHPSAVKKQVPSLQIDLSAIAKGYAVDMLGELLRQQGYENYLVEIGGELQASGHRPGNLPWRIALEKPLEGKREIETILNITGTALATSGNYRNFYVENGERYAHTIDPVSGLPVRHQLASVTVLDPSCARADALATAMMVMGEDKARIFSEKHDVPVYLIIHQGTGSETYRSPAFGKFMKGQQP